MEKKVLKIILCLIITVVCLLYSCTADNSSEDTQLFEKTIQTENYEEPEQKQEKTESENEVKSEADIEGEAPAEDEYEPEIYDGY